MQIKISARHGSLSDTTQEKIRTKLEKLSRFFERLTEIKVAVDLERRDAPVVDVRALAEPKHEFVASAQADELMAALDVVSRKLEQQIRKYKEKLQDRHRGSGHRQQETPTQAGESRR